MRVPFFFKKRGHRTTSPRVLGLFWGMTLFAVSLAVGITAGVTLVRAWIMPEWRIHQQFVEGTAEVLDRRVEVEETDHGPVFQPRVLIRYQVNGASREEWTYDLTEMAFANRAESEAIIAGFPVGRKLPCWYDPLSPDTVVIVRGATWRMWGFLLLPLPFLAVGVIGLVYCVVHWRASAESRAVMSRRLSGRDLIETFRETDKSFHFPSVPDDDDIRNSPGTRLPYRLPCLSGSWNGVAQFIVAATCVATGISGAAVAWSGRDVANPDLVILAFSGVLILAGVSVSGSLVRVMRQASRAGISKLEISEHPLIRGRIIQGVLFHSGWGELKGLEVLLACEEVAIFRQGTDIRTEVRRVYEATCLFQPSVHVHPRQPVELPLEIECPEVGPHSFRSPHNEIRWFLVVRAEISPRERIERRFPVIVLPGGARREHGPNIAESVPETSGASRSATPSQGVTS